MPNMRDNPIKKHAQESLEAVAASPQWQDVCLYVIQGQHAAEFLQGYLTCDCQKLSQTTTIPMAICTIKGRVLANGWALALPEGVGLLIHQSLLKRVAGFLKPYINFSKCSANIDAVRSVSLNTTPSDHPLGDDRFLHLHTDPDIPREDQSASVNAWLIDQGFCLVSSPVSEQFLPQMLNLDQLGAVDFDKGCYLGQEIVARAQFRGAVKRQLRPFSWQNGKTPQLGLDWPGAGIVVAQQEDNEGGTGLGVVKI